MFCPVGSWDAVLQRVQLNLNLTPKDQAVFGAVKADVDLGVAELQAGRPVAALKLFQGVLSRLPEGFSARPALWQTIVIACKEAVEKFVTTGAEAAGDEWAKIALSAPDLPPSASLELRRFSAEALKCIGVRMFEVGRHDHAVALYRKALVAVPSTTYRINLSIALFMAHRRAVLADFTTSVTPDQLAPKLLVACVPKSGSSFLYNVLSFATGWKGMRAFGPAGQFQQELQTDNLIEYAGMPAVLQQHCRATEPNLQIMEAFRIRPVILVRNFADALLSLLESYRNGAYRSTLFQDDFPQLSPEAQIDLLIEHRMPWYFEFVASWQRVERTRRLPVFWLTYEEFMADKVGTVRRLLEYWDLKATDERIEQALAHAASDRKKTRYNVGQTGRGRAALSEEQFQRLASYARFFPSTDFSKVGLMAPSKPPKADGELSKANEASGIPTNLPRVGAG